jgi:hypothetical protein
LLPSFSSTTTATPLLLLLSHIFVIIFIVIFFFSLADHFVLLILTQVLKYEPDHDSPLVRMLLRRAIRNPLRLGQMFFWMLRSEMHLHCINDRYGLVLKLYLQRCGPHKTTLSRQLFINESLTSIAQVGHCCRLFARLLDCLIAFLSIRSLASSDNKNACFPKPKNRSIFNHPQPNPTFTKNFTSKHQTKQPNNQPNNTLATLNQN